MNDPKRQARSRRRLKLAGLALAALIALLVVVSLSFHLWMHPHVPPHAPRIAISLDDTWLAELGFTRSMYERAIARAGGRLFAFKASDTDTGPVDMQQLAKRLSSLRIDGLLLSGGGDVDPRLYGVDGIDATLVDRPRDDFEIALIEAAVSLRLPVLGVCRGCQILNVARGGTLENLRTIPDLESRHFSIHGHAVDIVAGSHLAEALHLLKLDRVQSFHGQSVGAPGRGVRVVAAAPDGVAEAIEFEGTKEAPWAVGVQWHPEMAVGDVEQQRLFQAFVDQARKARERR